MAKPVGEWEFDCPSCGLGHAELGHLACDEDIFCPVCEHETGRQIKLLRWLPDERPAPQARLRLVRRG